MKTTIVGTVSWSEYDCRVIFNQTPKRNSLICFDDGSIACCVDIQHDICKLVKLNKWTEFLANVFIGAEVTIYNPTATDYNCAFTCKFKGDIRHR